MNAPDWAARAAALQPDGRAVIDGVRVDAADGARFDKHSPIDGRRLAAVARGRAADIDAAVKAARAAFDDRRWAGKAPAVRKRILQRFAERITAARDELALLETLDMGKPIQYALAVDVPATARTIAWYAEAVDKVYDEIAPTPDSALALITREPVGVVGVIVPWNYPMIMAAWKLGPALAAGNSVVLKPSEKSPLTALRLAELAVEAGVPPGVFNVVPGFGHEAGEALALHMDVDASASPAHAHRPAHAGVRRAQQPQARLQRARRQVGLRRLRRLRRPRARRWTAAGSMFFNQGESCNAPSRVLVHESVAERFVDIVAAEAPKYQPADPLQPGTELGALVDETQMRTVLGYIEAGEREGARLVCGGAARARPAVASTSSRRSSTVWPTA
jgi:acyl-CoA reductase-like NAD-dependent aldehyde dehydrogenase